MVVCYTCNDTTQAMVREEITLTVNDWDDACASTTWERVKTGFARRWKTKKDYVSITGVRTVSPDYRPARWE